MLKVFCVIGVPFTTATFASPDSFLSAEAHIVAHDIIKATVKINNHLPCFFRI
jgi:hypothetical protein